MSLEDRVAKTIEILSRSVTKTPLTPKLLSKPPFRYLHDLFSELINNQGFCAGLYTDSEMDSENVKDKDSKLNYLTKMIQVVMLATGVTVRANPLKIVSGLEPEETNAFLTLVGKMVLKKADTTAIVQKVLQGGGPDLNALGESKPKNGSQSDLKQSVNTVPTPVDPPAHAAKEETAKPPPAKKESVAPKTSAKRADAPSRSSSQSELKTSGSAANLPTEPSPAKKDHQASKASSKKAKEAAPEQEETFGAAASSTAHQDASHTVDHGATTMGNSQSVTESLSSEGLQSRTMTARRPPPKAKEPEKDIDDPLRNVPRTIIVEDGPDADGNGQDDEFVVSLTTEIDGGNQIERGGMGSLDGDDKHGGLVQKILQTKKELEGKVEEDLKNGTNTAAKELATVKEIEELRESIQALCRSTNPLGKMLDYVQEDVDGMNKESDQWRREVDKYQAQLNEELKATKKALEPVEAQLPEIEHSIDDVLRQIQFQKNVLIQNEVTIRNILANLVAPGK